MAKVNLLSTRTTNFLELIGNGRSYRVPAYQRDYSWNEEQWEDLWNDIVEQRVRSDDRHYMGALVVEGKSDRDFVIIDGQQRLATLSLLALAVISKLGDLAQRGMEPSSNRDRAAALRSRFVGEKDPASLVESSKLLLNDTDNAFYQDYLVQLRTPPNPRGLPRSNRLLWDCYRYWIQRLEAVPEFLEKGETLAALLSETVARQLLFILITVDDELNAYTVFETLNARGLELSATDLLKNYLFSRIRVATDLAVLQRRWRALIATVKQERFPDFLRYHLLCELPKIRGPRLFKIVRDRVGTPEQVFALVESLEHRAETYAALSDPSHAYWLEAPACRPHVRELNLFRVSQMTPLVFVARERLSGTEFERLLRLISVATFRYTVVGGLNPNALEPVYHEAAKAVLEGRIDSAAGLFPLLRTIYVEDPKFEQDFSRLGVETSGQSKKLAKYILARLEADRSQRPCDPETDPATIEHILPENPDESWAASFPQAYWEAAVYRIGNLALLEAAANRRAGSAGFLGKLDEYRSSRMVSTRDIAELAPGEWTLELLEERQRRLAGRAVNIWRADFS